MFQKVLIVGAGELGSAIGHVLREQQPGVTVELWDKDASKVQGQRELKQAALAAEVIFLCVPSWVLREAAEQLAGLSREGVPIVTMAKGLEEKTGRTAVEVLGEVFPRNPVVFIGGPMLAEEMLGGMMGVGLAGCLDITVAQAVQKILDGRLLRIETTDDVQGIALAGVLKNTYAMVMGLMCYLYPGSNMKGWLVARAVQEMRLIAARLGVKDEIVTSVAGLGDLVTTGFSSYSSNSLAGQELASRGRTGVHSEGLASLLDLLHKLGPEVLKKTPLLKALGAVVIDKQDAMEAFKPALKA